MTKRQAKQEETRKKAKEPELSGSSSDASGNESYSEQSHSEADYSDAEYSECEPSDAEHSKVEPSENASAEKKDRKTSRDEQKRLREERKGQKPGGDALMQAKPVWAKACRRELPEAERAQLMATLFELLRGKWAEVAMKHDGSRIVQTCVKHGTSKQRAELAQELRGHFAEVAKSRYGKHIVIKLLLHCPEQREMIMGDFFGKLDKLLRHRDASQVVETIYRDYCNGKKRARMVREFYGPEYALFHQEEVDLDTLMARNREKGELILKNLEAALAVHLQKGSTLQLSIVHRLLLDYLSHLPPTRAQEWMQPMLEMLPEIIHTSEGSRAAMRCIALASAKERKTIVKACKPFLARICADDRAYQVLICLLDLTDDTVLTGKSLVGELKAQLSAISQSLCGRRVLLTTCLGISSHILPPDVIKALEEARSLARQSATTKKDVAAKQQELSALLKDDLLAHLVEQAATILPQPEWSVFVIELLASLGDGAAAALEQCLAKLETPFKQPAVCEVLKRLLKKTPVNCSATILKLADLDELLGSETGFILLGMLHHAEIADQIKKSKALKKSKSAAAEVIRRKLT